MDSIHENFSSAVLPDFFYQKLLCIFYPDVDVFCKCNNTIEKNRLFLLLCFFIIIQKKVTIIGCIIKGRNDITIDPCPLLHAQF